ncbi:PBP/GOBP family [Popillia japonica]|uniref:PBP/GOBP family n=1 Tax=Popillia japonica TaxID=7064 RepID=A0AAW1MBW7_POPJA
MLKLVVLLTLGIYVPAVMSMSEEMEELAKQLHDDCVSQTGVDEAHITTVKDQKGFPDDEKFKCYLKCLNFIRSSHYNCQGSKGISR